MDDVVAAAAAAPAAIAATSAAAPAAPLLRLEYTPEASEFVEASLVTFRDRRIRSVMLNVIFAPLVAFIGWIEHSALGFAVAAAMVLLAIFQPFLARRMLRDYFHKHPQLGESSVATYWPEGLLVQTASAEMLIRWHAFTHFTESRRLFFLHRGPGNPLFLAKRVFADSEALAAYRQLLMNLIGRTAQAHRHAFPIQPIGWSSPPVAEEQAR